MDTIPQNTPQKQCTGECKQVLPATLEYFLPRKESKDGFRNQCKACVIARRQKRYQEHREERLTDRREYYQENKEAVCAQEKIRRQEHKEEICEYRKVYYQEHREEQLAHSKELNRANKEKGHVYAKDYYRANRDQYYAHNHNRRARLKGVGGTHTAKDIRKQYDNQKGKCYYDACGHKKLGKNRSDYEVDHIIPVARGGSNDPSNLVITCHECNDAKRAKLPHEWPEGGRLM